MTQLPEDNKNTIKLIPIIICIGLWGLGATLFSYNRAYLGQELTERTLVLSLKPERIYRHRSADHYVFKAKGYPCKFLISEAASFVDKYKHIQDLVEEINEGDTIEVSICSTDRDAVYDASKQVEIIGLKYNTIQLIPPAEVAEEGSESLKMSGIIFSAIFFIGVCSAFYRKVFPSEEN